MSSIRVALVQPIQAPYWTNRLKWLGRDPRLECTLLLERIGFEHRPGWKPVPIEGVKVEVLGSSLINTKNRSYTGIESRGGRLISWKLGGWILMKRPDVVVVCNATQLLLAYPVCRAIGTTLALIVEDTPYVVSGLSRGRKVIKKLVYRCADFWFAFSNDARDFLASYGIRDNIIRTSWSVDVRRFQGDVGVAHKKGEEAAVRNKMVLFVGALIPSKGIIELTEAWLSIPQSKKNGWSLVIVGSGPLEGELLKMIACSKDEMVRYVGQKTYDEVIDLYQKAEVLALPTLKDLFSLTVVEAMAAGCAVITTRYNGARELVEEGVNGWIVDPLVQGEMRRVLREVIDSGSKIEQMRRQSLQKAVALDNQLVMAQFADELVNMVEKRRVVAD